MIIVLTRNGYILTEGKADRYVTDDTFIHILKSESIRRKLLEERKTLTIGRIGVERQSGLWNKGKDKAYIDATDNLNFRKEFGYYARYRC